MDAVTFVKRLRWVATASWLGALAAALGLARAGVVPSSPALPFLALAAGSVPIALFWMRAAPTCKACGARMRVSSAFPRIVYRCTRCGAEVHTGIHSDF